MLGFSPFAANPFAAVIAGDQIVEVTGVEAAGQIGYEELIAPLIKAIQELKAEFDEYKRTHP